jgi:hypothetical protein
VLAAEHHLELDARERFVHALQRGIQLAGELVSADLLDDLQYAIHVSERLLDLVDGNYDRLRTVQLADLLLRPLRVTPELRSLLSALDLQGALGVAGVVKDSP